MWCVFANGCLEYFNLVSVDQYAHNDSTYNAPVRILSHQGFECEHLLRLASIHCAYSLRAWLHVACIVQEPPSEEIYSEKHQGQQYIIQVILYE